MKTPHDAIDPDAVPTAEELAQAEALARALERGPTEATVPAEVAEAVETAALLRQSSQAPVPGQVLDAVLPALQARCKRRWLWPAIAVPAMAVALLITAGTLMLRSSHPMMRMTAAPVSVPAAASHLTDDSILAKGRRIVDIIPGESIGDARLGVKVDELPSRAILDRPAGVLDDIQLLINDAGMVEDVWIDDVHKFPHVLRCQGKVIPRNATLDSIQTIVGKCEPVPGIKGGSFYNCAVGLALGTDFSQRTLQIRVKPISTK